MRSSGGHPLQLWGWGEVKSADGVWRAERYQVKDKHGATIGGAQVLIRRLPWPFRETAYVPRGPFGEQTEKVAGRIAAHLQQHSRAHVVTYEPHSEKPFTPERGRPNASPILLPSTLILDLTQSGEELQSAATKKTRQYIRKSQNSGVTIRRADKAADVDVALQIYRETAARAGFALHSDQYYHRLFTEMGDAAPLYMAEVENDGTPEAVAFLWLAASDDIAFELYGGVTALGQKLRANYALKWEVILDQQSRGVKQYDMNGLLNDGVSQFKRGFADHDNEMTSGADIPLNSRYVLWAKALPAVREMRRKITERRARRQQS